MNTPGSKRAHVPLLDALRIAGKDAHDFLGHKWVENPLRAADAYTRTILNLGAHGGVGGVDETTIQTVGTSSILVGRWAVSGYHTVTMGHRTAAALMTTRIKPDDAAELVHIPWPAFMIRVPHGLLEIEYGGKNYPGTVILVASISEETLKREVDWQPIEGLYPGKDRWWYKLFSEEDNQPRPEWMSSHTAALYGGITLWGFNLSTELMAMPSIDFTTLGGMRWDTCERQDIDKRSEAFVRSLILGCCICLDGKMKHEKLTHRERLSKPRPDLPQYIEHELTLETAHNLHHAVRDYVRTGGTSPTYGTMVEPHWKNQAYGPGWSLHRLTYIDAYFRGPRDN